MSRGEAWEAYVALAKLTGALSTLRGSKNNPGRYERDYWTRHTEHFLEILPDVWTTHTHGASHFLWFNNSTGNTHAIDIRKIGCLPSSLTEESSNV